MPHSQNHREVQYRMLDQLAKELGRPVELYEMENGEPQEIASPSVLHFYDQHCIEIQKFPRAREACKACQARRAREAFDRRTGALELCHAGMYNWSEPLISNGEVRAVLLLGELRLTDAQHREAALNNHRQAMKNLGIDDEVAERLRKLLLPTQPGRYITEYQVEEIAERARLLAQWYLASVVGERDKLLHEFGIVIHEVQTQLQAVVADAENLAEEAPLLTKEEVQKQASEILFGVLKLSTVVHSMGDFLEDYHFTTEVIFRLLDEARATYEPEAARRGVTINIRMADFRQELEVSRRHLQHALNNLVHNAIKYSFHGLSDRQRRVFIIGRALENGYKITIENYGIGILPEEIENRRIFEDGYQGRLTHNEYRPGAGKGLHFVDRVISQHHGTITVESRPITDEEDLGGKPHLNRFTVFLPYRQPQGGQAHGEDHRVDRR